MEPVDLEISYDNLEIKLLYCSLDIRLRRSRSHRITPVVVIRVCSFSLRIFVIFCMKAPYYKGKKCTQRFFPKNSGSFKMLRNSAYSAPKNIFGRLKVFVQNSRNG